MSDTDPTIAATRACGCIVFVSMRLDDPDAWGSMRRCVADGFKPRTDMTVADVQNASWECSQCTESQAVKP